MTSQKLQAVLDEHGDKLLNLTEVAKLELQEYSSQLSKLEIVRVFAAAAKPKRMIASALFTATSGKFLQSSDGRTFATVAAYQEMSEASDAASPSKLSKRVEEKAENATADAILRATDYSGQRQSLGLRPIG